MVSCLALIERPATARGLVTTTVYDYGYPESTQNDTMYYNVSTENKG